MPTISFPAALAAQVLAQRQSRELVLQLELPAPTAYFEEPRRREEMTDGETLDALVLEADGSFTEIRD